MRPLKTRVSLTIDENLFSELKMQAEKEERSLSQFVNMILKEHLDKKGVKYERSHFKRLMRKK